jgi:hypothetical protein
MGTGRGIRFHEPAAGIFVIVLVMFELFLSLGKTTPWK